MEKISKIFDPVTDVESIIPLSGGRMYRMVFVNPNGAFQTKHIHSRRSAEEYVKKFDLISRARDVGDDKIWNAFNPHYIASADAYKGSEGASLTMRGGEILHVSMSYQEIVEVAGLTPGFKYNSGYPQIEELAINPTLIAMLQEIGIQDTLKNSSGSAATEVWFKGGEDRGRGLMISGSLEAFEARLRAHQSRNIVVLKPEISEGTAADGRYQDIA